jgi:hypothetical protein
LASPVHTPDVKPTCCAPEASTAMSNEAKSRALTVMALPWTAAAFKHNPWIAG